MDILISSYKKLSDMIFDGYKPFEFRHNIPKKLRVGDKVYIYEPAPGAQKIVGEFTLGGLSDISGNKLGFLPFFQYYVGTILNDPELYKLAKRCYSIKCPYNAWIPLKYMFCEDILDYMEKNHDVPKNIDYLGKRDKLEKADKLVSDCDEWLTRIGFYNLSGESDYRYVFEIQNPIRYSIPYSIEKIRAGNGQTLRKAPQSWCYVSKIEK